MSRRLLRQIARWLVGVLLLSQLAIAAYACPSLLGAGSWGSQTAVDRLPDEPAQAGAADAVGGCGDAMGVADPASPNLCAEHCKVGQQSDHAASIVVPAPLPALLYVHIPLARPVPRGRPSATNLNALVAASPPHAILHCVRRT